MSENSIEDQDDVALEQWKLDFSAAKSVRYHAYRRSFWEAFDHWTKIISIFSGTAVVVSIVGEKSFLAQVFSVVVAITSASDVVFRFGDRAKKHDALYREWCQFQEDISMLSGISNEDISRFRARRFRIEREEPAIIDLLERRCAAEECIARGCEMRDLWKLRTWQVWLSQWAMWPSPRL